MGLCYDIETEEMNKMMEADSACGEISYDDLYF